MEREKIVIELCGGKMPEKAHDADAAYNVFTKEDMEMYEGVVMQYLLVLRYSFRYIWRQWYSQEAACLPRACTPE